MMYFMKRISLLLAIAFFSFQAIGQTSCFSEGFADITTGDNISTNNNSGTWNGNSSFPTVEKAFKAGGAVKLGTGSLIGSIESDTLYSVFGDITVKVWVKGWTTVEGDLKISIDGQEETLTYAAKMADPFEEISANFIGVTAGSNLKIETTARRAFIDSVAVICNTAATVCEDVTNLQLVDNGDGTFTATWTEPTDPNDGYYIMITGQNTSYFFDDEITGDTYTSEVLDSDDYEFFISTICDDVQDIVSDGVADIVNVENIPVVATCNEPTNVVVTSNNDGTVTVTWTAPNPAPADGYGVAIVPTFVEIDDLTISDFEIITSTTYLSDSLANGDYHAFVFAICDLANENGSDPVETADFEVKNTVGLSNLTMISAVYPNPVKTVLTVETNANNGNITVMNLLGQTIESISVNGNVTTINVANLPTGVYQIVYTSNEGKMIARFIKE